MAAQQVRVALDSKYLIALLCDWHAQHHRTLRSYEHWHDRDAQIILPAHAILVLLRVDADAGALSAGGKLRDRPSRRILRGVPRLWE
jgi:hypothetical protein